VKHVANECPHAIASAGWSAAERGQARLADRWLGVPWLDGRLRGRFRHLLVAASLPFLFPMGLHHVESWTRSPG
jgi:hypothetical protein